MSEKKVIFIEIPDNVSHASTNHLIELFQARYSNSPSYTFIILPPGVKAVSADGPRYGVREEFPAYSYEAWGDTKEEVMAMRAEITKPMTFNFPEMDPEKKAQIEEIEKRIMKKYAADIQGISIPQGMYSIEISETDMSSKAVATPRLDWKSVSASTTSDHIPIPSFNQIICSKCGETAPFRSGCCGGTEAVADESVTFERKSETASDWNTKAEKWLDDTAGSVRQVQDDQILQGSAVPKTKEIEQNVKVLGELIQRMRDDEPRVGHLKVDWEATDYSSLKEDESVMDVHRCKAAAKAMGSLNEMMMRESEEICGVTVKEWAGMVDKALQPGEVAVVKRVSSTATENFTYSYESGIDSIRERLMRNAREEAAVILNRELKLRGLRYAGQLVDPSSLSDTPDGISYNFKKK